MAIAKKKKKFFDVEIPLIKKTTNLIAYELKELEGRTISYDLTRNLKGKNVLLKTKVFLDKDEATSKPLELVILPSFMKRAVRKGTDYVEDSFSINCKDAQIKIKPFLVTRRKVSKAVRKVLREKIKEELTNYVKSKTVEKIFDDVLKNTLQKELSLKMKKTYPLSLCEIRTIKVEKEFEPKKEKEEKPKKEKISEKE